MRNQNTDIKLKFPIIGELTLFDVLVKTETPIVFVCKDLFETMYLFYEINYSQTITEWLTMKITRNQYLALKTNEIDLQALFEDSIDNAWLIIKENSETDELDVQILKLFPEYCFPYIDPIFVGKIEKDDKNLNEIFLESYDDQESFFDVRILNKNNAYNPMTVSIQPSILVKIADTVRLFFKKFVISEDSIKLQLVRGSTIVRFRFENVNLLSQDDTTKVLKRVERAMQSSSSLEIFNAFDGDKEKISKYREFIDSIRIIDKNIEVSAITPNKSVFFKKRIDDKFINDQFDKIDNIYFEEEEEKTINGELYSINVNSKKIEFYDTNRNKVKAELDFEVERDKITVPKEYTFRVLVRKSVDSQGNIKKITNYIKHINTV